MSVAGNSIFPWTLIASAAITAQRFVTALGAPATATSGAVGVARSAAAIGEPFPVDCLGAIPVEAGAAVAVGARIGADASGRAVTAAAGTWTALSAATAAGETILIAPLMILPA